jgi:hypothetical protein
VRGIALFGFVIIPVVILVELPLFILRAIREEKLLESHFKDKFVTYKKNSGFIIPFNRLIDLMLNKPLLIILLSLFISTSLTAQRMLKISVSIDGKEEHLSYISRKGVSYISAIDLCKILGAGSYYNVDANKVDMKFRDFNLKVTGRNQFFVLTSRTNNSQQVYQIPISTLLMRDDVFMPIQYSLKYIMMAYGQEIIFK